MNTAEAHVERRPLDDPRTAMIGDYALLERLGAGGMGEVWIARRETSFDNANKVVALKLLSASLSRSIDAQRLFKTEARLSMMLSHSNIVQVFDVGQAQGRLFLAMEWVDGVDLESVLRFVHDEGRELGPELAAYIIGEILEGLEYAHGLFEGGMVEAIVHRDISPHNLLTSVSGEVKITDFGIARLRSEETSGVHVRGKLRYMPPEQINGRARRPSVDLFAAGAVFYELLTGACFRGQIPIEELFTAVARGYVPSTDIPGIPLELRILLDGLLEPDPRRRMESAGEGLEVLRSWSGGRNCRAELAELVREISGIEGPRSGLSIAGQAAAVAKMALDTDSLTRPRSPQSLSRLAAERLEQTSDEYVSPEAGTVIELHPQPGPPARIETERVEPEPPSRSRRWFAASVVLASISAVLLGLVLARSVDANDEPRPSSELDDEREGIPTRIEQAMIHTPTLASHRGGELRTRPPSMRGRASQGQARRAPEGQRAAGSGAPEQAAAPAQVTFTSGEFHWLAIKVGGRELSLDPRASTRLSRGRHRVEIKVGAEWREAGELELAAGQRYRVDFLQPARISVRELD